MPAHTPPLHREPGTTQPVLSQGSAPEIRPVVGNTTPTPRNKSKQTKCRLQRCRGDSPQPQRSGSQHSRVVAGPVVRSSRLREQPDRSSRVTRLQREHTGKAQVSLLRFLPPKYTSSAKLIWVQFKNPCSLRLSTVIFSDEKKAGSISSTNPLSIPETRDSYPGTIMFRAESSKSKLSLLGRKLA